MPKRFGNISFGDWYLIIIGLVFLAAIILYLLVELGIYQLPPERGVVYADHPQFDRMECINRNSYQIRENDPTISDEMLSGDVARACGQERENFYGS